MFMDTVGQSLGKAQQGILKNVHMESRLEVQFGIPFKRVAWAEVTQGSSASGLSMEPGLLSA